MRCVARYNSRLSGLLHCKPAGFSIMARSKRKSEAIGTAAGQTTGDMEQQPTGARKTRRASALQAAGDGQGATETGRKRKQTGGTAADSNTAEKPVKQTKKRGKSTSITADSNAEDGGNNRHIKKQAARPRKRSNADAGEGDAPSSTAQAGAKSKGRGKAAVAPCPPVPTTGYWLMKNEPDELSMESLQDKPDQTAYWDGVRNYQARNFMRQMKIGDQIMFYYSSCKVPGIAGIVKVVKEAYPDHTAWDAKSNYHDPKSTPEKPVWDMVDVQAVRHLPRFLTLEELRRHSVEGGLLHGMLLFTRFRLSVMPLSEEHWNALLQLADKEPEAHPNSKAV